MVALAHLRTVPTPSFLHGQTSAVMEVLAALVEAYHIVTKKTDVSEQHLMKHYANYCLAVDDIVSPNGVGEGGVL